MKKTISILGLCAILQTSCITTKYVFGENKGNQKEEHIELREDSSLQEPNKTYRSKLDSLWFRDETKEIGIPYFISYDNYICTLLLESENRLFLGVEDKANCMLTAFKDIHRDEIVDQGEKYSKDVNDSYIPLTYSRESTVQKNSYLELLFQEEFTTHMRAISTGTYLKIRPRTYKKMEYK